MSNHCQATPVLWEHKKAVFLTVVRQGNRAAASAPLGKYNLALATKFTRHTDVKCYKHLRDRRYTSLSSRRDTCLEWKKLTTDN